MPGNEQQSHQLWKSQEEESMELSTELVRAKALRYEKESVAVYWTVLAITPLFVGAFLYNMFRLNEPWLVAGAGLALTAFVGMVWKVVRTGPTKLVPAEPCAHFLRREFEAKRKGLLCVRTWLLLLIPAVVASWWGDGPELRARALGIHSPSVLNLLKGPAPLIVMGLIVGFLWFAFSHQARKVDLEIENLRDD
jgi:hypothetical protein